MATSELLDPIGLAVHLASTFDRLGIDYVLGGSLASSLIGEPRATNDVDIAVQLSIEATSPLVEHLRQEFYVDAEAAQEAVLRRSSFNVIHLSSMLKADIFVLGDSLIDRLQIQRRRRVLVSTEPKVELWVGSVEDQVLRKLFWFQEGGEVSDRQWRDIVGILTVQRDSVDLDLLRKDSTELGLAALLDRAVSDLGGHQL